MTSMRNTEIGSTLAPFNMEPSCVLIYFLNYATFGNVSVKQNFWNMCWMQKMVSFQRSGARAAFSIVEPRLETLFYSVVTAGGCFGFRHVNTAVRIVLWERMFEFRDERHLCYADSRKFVATYARLVSIYFLFVPFQFILKLFPVTSFYLASFCETIFFWNLFVSFD